VSGVPVLDGSLWTNGLSLLFQSGNVGSGLWGSLSSGISGSDFVWNDRVSGGVDLSMIIPDTNLELCGRFSGSHIFSADYWELSCGFGLAIIF
jgi:hypothetical protein